MNYSRSLPAAQAQSVAPIGDDELTALALAADPGAPLSDDAVPWNVFLGHSANLLPEWYMPQLSAVRRSLGARVVTYGLISGMVVICAFGLCVTSGWVSVA